LPAFCRFVALGQTTWRVHAWVMCVWGCLELQHMMLQIAWRWVQQLQHMDSKTDFKWFFSFRQSFIWHFLQVGHQQLEHQLCGLHTGWLNLPVMFFSIGPDKRERHKWHLWALGCHKQSIKTHSKWNQTRAPLIGLAAVTLRWCLGLRIITSFVTSHDQSPHLSSHLTPHWSHDPLPHLSPHVSPHMACLITSHQFMTSLCNPTLPLCLSACMLSFLASRAAWSKMLSFAMKTLQQEVACCECIPNFDKTSLVCVVDPCLWSILNTIRIHHFLSGWKRLTNVFAAVIVICFETAIILKLVDARHVCMWF